MAVALLVAAAALSAFARPVAGAPPTRGPRLGGFSASVVYRAVSRSVRRPESVPFLYQGLDSTWGTGVFVGRSPNGRHGLLLTVAHNVLPMGSGRRAYVQVDGKRAAVKGVVAINPELDYALVRVERPRQKLLERMGDLLGATVSRGRSLLGRAPASAAPARRARAGELPAPAELAAMGAREPVYLNGYPTPEASRTTGRVRYGWEINGGKRLAVGTTPESPAVPSQVGSYSSGVGFSGAPVFSQRTDRLVGLHHANNFLEGKFVGGQEVSYSVPMEAILTDVARQLASGKISRRDRAAVTDLLARASATPPPATTGPVAPPPRGSSLYPR